MEFDSRQKKIKAKPRYPKIDSQKKYSEINHKVRKSARSDKRRLFNELAQDARASAENIREGIIIKNIGCYLPVKTGGG